MPKKVLVAEDSSVIQNLTKKILQMQSFEISSVKNGQQVLDILKKEKFDIILMDINMPVMDGMAALKAITSLDPNAHVVMVTAIGQQSVVIEALKAGAKDFVVKPFQPDRVLGAVAKMAVA